jgi:hypothetical protein
MRTLIGLAVAAVVGFAPATHAQTRTWDGTTGTWGTAARWSLPDVPGTAAGSAVVGAGTVTVDANSSLGGLAFSGGTPAGSGVPRTLTPGGAFDWSGGTVGSLRVARTVADPGGSDRVAAEHVAEPVGYRTLDRKRWRR